MSSTLERSAGKYAESPAQVQRVLNLADQGLKPHSIARELMGEVSIANIYEILTAHRRETTLGPCWRAAEAALAKFDRDLTADDFVSALHDVTGREPRRLSVLQQLSRRARWGILARVGRGTYRVVQQLPPDDDESPSDRQ
jgi:hypothetical protein